MKILFYILSALILLSCSDYSPNNKIKQALKLSGNNRNELEKVLTHYSKQPKDSLKYKAACFLIENMPYHYHCKGNDIDKYYHEIKYFFSKENGTREEMNSLLNEIQKHQTYSSSFHYDIQSITAEYLISHIEHSFETRKHSWTEHISFDDFCEYVLPYRLNHEPFELWIDIYQKYLYNKIDSLNKQGIRDSAVCVELLSLLDPDFFTLIDNSFVYDLKPSLLLEMNAGTCNELSSLGIFAFRSAGLPVAYDYTPQWANRILGHNWTSILINGKTQTFQIDDNVPFGQHLPSKADDKLAKVYRKTYSIQEESLFMQNINEEIPPIFYTPYMKDISDLYFNGIDIEVYLNIAPPQKRKIAYIMAFNNKEWKPLAWSKIENNKTIFSKMNKDCAYMVMYYCNEKYYPASEPFYADKEGNIKILNPNTTKKQTVELKRKYPNFDIGILRDRMPGGKFQIATKPDFSDAVTIHTIDTLQDLMPQYIKFDKEIKCKYFRYLSSDKGHVFLAELELYNNEKKVEGKIIGTEGSFGNTGYDRTRVFDGDVLTYFDAPESAGCWVGMAFKKKESVSEIMYLPRNNDNYIKQFEEYELFYYDKEFISLGKQIGDKSHTLFYNNVPENALLLLRNNTKGMQERIFTYENGKQVWW